MIFLVSSLSFVGDTLGAFRYYYNTEIGSTHQTKDSVFSVDIWDGSGTRCSFSVDRAIYRTHHYDIVPYEDTSFVYFDGTFLVDILNTDLVGIPLPIKHLKFPLISGDRWQAIDTCLYPLRTYYPYAHLDTDSIIDSIYVDTAGARIYVYGDTSVVQINDITIRIKTTERRVMHIDTVSGDTLIYTHFTIHRKFNMRVKYVAYMGYISLHIDTLYEAISYDIIHTTPYDSTHIPPVFTGRTDYYIRTYIPSSLYENERVDSPYPEIIRIYDITGRKIFEDRIIGTEKVKLKNGVYFIMFGNRARKVILK